MATVFHAAGFAVEGLGDGPLLAAVPPVAEQDGRLVDAALRIGLGLAGRLVGRRLERVDDRAFRHR
ncbi:MAG: hypothetical protein AUG44_19980 [Actinobacteria bacterium 13_1_20CM_3_71_11]|nr:MAG: hypothetical protein AUG44_19980 [Actinobacteria bacterium 13_1_20CM_3_71_11]